MVPAPHRMASDEDEVTEKEYYRGEVPRADDDLLGSLLAVAKALDADPEVAS
jgi:hypothetical protein